MKEGILGILFLFIWFEGSCQTEQHDWRLYNPTKSEVDSVKQFNQKIKNNQPGKVLLFKDSRIDKLTDQIIGDSTIAEQERFYGYRVQIKISQNKNDVNQLILSFEKNFPDIPITYDWRAPNYYVQAGDCRNKLEAEKIKHELSDIFPAAYIIKTMIYLPKL